MTLASCAGPNVAFALIPDWSIVAAVASAATVVAVVIVHL